MPQMISNDPVEKVYLNPHASSTHTCGIINISECCVGRLQSDRRKGNCSSRSSKGGCGRAGLHALAKISPSQRIENIRGVHWPGRKVELVPIQKFVANDGAGRLFWLRRHNQA